MFRKVIILMYLMLGVERGQIDALSVAIYARTEEE